MLTLALFLYNCFPPSVFLGGDEGRNGFSGPPGTGPGPMGNNELGIDLSGEIWVETPADGGQCRAVPKFLFTSRADHLIWFLLVLFGVQLVAEHRGLFSSLPHLFRFSSIFFVDIFFPLSLWFFFSCGVVWFCVRLLQYCALYRHLGFCGFFGC